MEGQERNVIMAGTLAYIVSAKYVDYLGHALCLGGSCELVYNGARHEVHRGDLMIVRKGKLIECVKPDDDFVVKVVCVTSKFVDLCIPQSNYGTKGQLALFLNPIMHLNECQYELCRSNFASFQARLAQRIIISIVI